MDDTIYKNEIRIALEAVDYYFPQSNGTPQTVKKPDWPWENSSTYFDYLGKRFDITNIADARSRLTALLETAPDKFQPERTTPLNMKELVEDLDRIDKDKLTENQKIHLRIIKQQESLLNIKDKARLERLIKAAKANPDNPAIFDNEISKLVIESAKKTSPESFDDPKFEQDLIKASKEIAADLRTRLLSIDNLEPVNTEALANILTKVDVTENQAVTEAVRVTGEVQKDILQTTKNLLSTVVGKQIATFLYSNPDIEYLLTQINEPHDLEISLSKAFLVGDGFGKALQDMSIASEFLIKNLSASQVLNQGSSTLSDLYIGNATRGVYRTSPDAQESLRKFFISGEAQLEIKKLLLYYSLLDELPKMETASPTNTTQTETSTQINTWQNPNYPISEYTSSSSSKEENSFVTRIKNEIKTKVKDEAKSQIKTFWDDKALPYLSELTESIGGSILEFLAPIGEFFTTAGAAIGGAAPEIALGVGVVVTAIVAGIEIAVGIAVAGAAVIYVARYLKSTLNSLKNFFRDFLVNKRINLALLPSWLKKFGFIMIACLLGFVFLMVMILFIINSGAYVTPSTGMYGSQNQYIDVEKVADPAGPFQNSNLPLTVTYNITITAKKGPLTNISFKEDCQVIKKGTPPACPNLSGTLPKPPTTILPGQPFSFLYKITYSNSYTDSAIINTLTVTADVPDQKGTSSDGNASVIIGNPPTSCFTFDNSWNPSDENQVKAAIAQLSQATTYMATLCAAWGNIPLTYSNDSVNYAGYFSGKGIVLYHYGLAYGIHGTLYTLAHESGHAYAAKTGAYQLFLDTPGLTQPICTYLLSYHPRSEDFAEMIGLYVAKTPNANTGCMTNFKTQYANYWQFAHDHIFFQNLGW